MYAKKLGLEPVKIATQVVQRDRHAELLSTIAVVGGTLDKNRFGNPSLATY